MATKKLDTVSPIISATLTAGADLTIADFRVTSSTGVVKSQIKPLASPVTLQAGRQIALADEAISVSYSGDLIGEAAAYATPQAYLDAKFVNGDKIEWIVAGAPTARLAATAITWAAATA